MPPGRAGKERTELEGHPLDHPPACLYCRGPLSKGRRRYCSTEHQSQHKLIIERAKRNAKDPSGFLYVLVHPLFPGVKIGKSAYPSDRLRVYQTGDPHKRYEMAALLAVPDRMAADKRARCILAPHKIAGEWFNLTPDEALEQLQELTDGDGLHRA